MPELPLNLAEYEAFCSCPSEKELRQSSLRVFKHFAVQEGVSTYHAVIRKKLCCLPSGPRSGNPGSLFALLISIINYWICSLVQGWEMQSRLKLWINWMQQLQSLLAIWAPWPCPTSVCCALLLWWLIAPGCGILQKGTFLFKKYVFV